MADVEWDNLDQVMAELEAEITDIVRGFTVEIYYHTLKMSPQYFGRYVSNWTYQIGSPDSWLNQEFDYEDEDSGYATIHKKGDWPAIESAVNHSKGRDSRFKLGDTVFISNNAGHANDIETGRINLRVVNQPGRPLTRAIDRATTWYGNDMKAKHALELRAMRIY